MTSQGMGTGAQRRPMLARLADQDPVPPIIVATVFWLLPFVGDYLVYGVVRLGSGWAWESQGQMISGLLVLLHVLARVAAAYATLVLAVKLHAVYLVQRGEHPTQAAPVERDPFDDRA